MLFGKFDIIILELVLICLSIKDVNLLCIWECEKLVGLSLIFVSFNFFLVKFCSVLMCFLLNNVSYWLLFDK